MSSSSLAVGILLLAAGLANAGEIPLTCPATLRVRHEALTRAEGGKGVAGEADHRLKSAGFSDGPADEQAFLKPESTRQTGNANVVEWRFGAGGSESIWLVCRYEGTAAVFTRKVGANVASCRATYTGRQIERSSVSKIACSAEPAR